MNMRSTIILGIPDLLFESKVNAIARMRGIATIPTFTPHDLLSKAHGENPGLLLIDLNAEQLVPFETIRSLKGDTHTASIKIVGFFHAIDAEQQSAAEGAGCDIVMSRSQFMQSLDEILTGKLGY
jgi:hypothetical protein